MINFQQIVGAFESIDCIQIPIDDIFEPLNGEDIDDGFVFTISNSDLEKITDCAYETGIGRMYEGIVLFMSIKREQMPNVSWFKGRPSRFRVIFEEKKS